MRRHFRILGSRRAKVPGESVDADLARQPSRAASPTIPHLEERRERPAGRPRDRGRQRRRGRAAVNGGSRSCVATASALPPEAFHDGEVARPRARSPRRCARSSPTHKLSKRVRLGIANQRVVVRTLRLPAIDDPEELDAAVRFQAQEQIPMPLDQAVLDHRVVGGVPAAEGAPPQIDVMRRRRPPRHDRRLAETAARRRPRTGRRRPLRLRHDPGARRPRRRGRRRSRRGAPADPPPRHVLYCNVGDVTNLAVARGRSCLFTRVSPVGLERRSRPSSPRRPA